VRLLVTGGAGFIGSNFIRGLLAAHPGYEVINLDKITYAGNLENLRDIESLPNYRLVAGDICDTDLVDSLDFDGIVHFAAESHVDRSILDSAPFLRTNVLGTVNLLEAVRKRRCRMLHVSTDEVYGSIAEGLFTESSPLMPNSPYSASKASSDLLVRSYYETYGLDVIVSRSSNNYGPYQFPEKLMPLVITHALEGKPVPVYGDGMNVRDWIYVQDHCAALDEIFHKGKPGEVYNVGGKNEQRNIDIVKKLLAETAAQTGGDEASLLGLITYVTDRPGHDRRYAIDPSKVEREFGWSPRTGFDQGISETVRWYLSHREWWGHILSGEYRGYYEAQYGRRLAQ
jgi:dTDP-glucose 4,6-dehydratase